MGQEESSEHPIDQRLRSESDEAPGAEEGERSGEVDNDPTTGFVFREDLESLRLWLAPEYVLEERDANTLVLRRVDDTVAAAFSVRSATKQGILEAAEVDYEALVRERAREQAKARSAAQLQRRRAQRTAAWKLFMQTELRELELRKAGQLARLLGEALPGESPVALERLASEDRRQAEEGLVALMSSGKMFYKHLEELTVEDHAARIAANRLRTTWLKERRDGWLGRGEGSP
jgi:hypothetical protein